MTTNLITFPDWTQPEDDLYQDLVNLIKKVANFQNTNLLVDTTGITEEEAELMFSSVITSLTLEEGLEISDSLELKFVGNLTDEEWLNLNKKVNGFLSYKNDDVMLEIKNRFNFSVDWFSHNIPIWKNVVTNFCASKHNLNILEIGVFEGMSTCWLLENIMKRGDKITVIDTFLGGKTYRKKIKCQDGIPNLRKIFEHNISQVNCDLKIEIRQGFSSEILPLEILEKGSNYYDLIYIDGSHTAPDVLFDAVLSFKLLKIGGLMIFDDYLWLTDQEINTDILETPKLAIDSFVNIYRKKIKIIEAQLYQFYLTKLSD